MSTKILGNEELNILRAKTPYSLPDNPSDKGFNARQIKTKFWEGYLLLFNWLKDTQASLNNDFATTNSALLNESKRIDVILTYFSNGKANFAVRDRNNNIIDETYELKTEASTKFNQLIADIQSVSSASGNKIAGSQNINADGIQYTITLSNTQNATLSTITQYLPLATTLKAGLLSSSDKEKLNNLESDLTNFLANAKAYTDEKLQRDNIVNILGAASHTLIGLLTSEDKKKIDALYALLGEKEDADTVVNTINEVLAIFSSYPEGVDIVSQLEKKVNYSDIINTLDSEETSKPLSAKMGKELKTEVDTKAELTYVNEELDKKALKSDILIIDGAVTAQESEITTTQSEGDKLVDEIVGYVDGSPRGVYASLSALQSAFPSGAQGVYVCTDNGHWYYWNGSAWADGGVYQATKIADGSVTPNKTNFCKYVNVLNPSEFIIGKDLNGSIGKIDSIFDSPDKAISAIINVSGYSKISYNFKQGGGTIYEFDVSGNLLKDSGWISGGTSGVITLQENTTQIRMSSGKDYITTKCIQLGEVGDNSFIEFGYVSIQTIEDKITNEKIGNEILKVKNELNDTIKSKCKMIESYQQIIPMDNLKRVANGDPTCDVFDDTNTYFSNKSKRITCTKVDGASKYLTWINLSNYNITNWESITIVVYVPYASYDYQGLNGARLLGYVNGNPGRGTIQFNGRVKWGWNFIKFRKQNKAPSPYSDLSYDLGQLTGINFVIEPRNTVPVGNKCSFIIDSIIIDLKMKPCVLFSFDFVSDETIANNGFNLLFDNNLKATMFSQNFGNFSTEHKNMYDKMVNEYNWELSCYGGANSDNSIIRSETNKVSDKTKDLASLLDEYYSVYSINPVSYACNQAVLDPKIEKAILNNNFKMIRALPTYVMTYFDKNCSLIPHIEYSDMTYEEIKNLIDDTIKYGDCLPLFTHSVKDDGSSSTLRVPYSIMEQVCNYLKTKVDAGEIEVLTYSEFYNRCVN